MPDPVKPPREERLVLLMLSTALASLTLLVTLLGAFRFDAHCRELGCLGILAFWTAAAVCGAGLLVGLFGLLRTFSSDAARRRTIGVVPIVLTTVGNAIAWFILYTMQGTW